MRKSFAFTSGLILILSTACNTTVSETDEFEQPVVTGIVSGRVWYENDLPRGRSLFIR